MVSPATNTPVIFSVVPDVSSISHSPICTELGKAPVASPQRAEYTPRKCQEKRIILIVCFFSLLVPSETVERHGDRGEDAQETRRCQEEGKKKYKIKDEKGYYFPQPFFYYLKKKKEYS